MGSHVETLGGKSPGWSSPSCPFPQNTENPMEEWEEGIREPMRFEDTNRAQTLE